MSQPSQRIAVMWPRFGPYHLARLRATHDLFAKRGVEVIGVETSGDDRLYDWRVEAAPEAFHRIQAFPDKAYEDLSPSEMHRGITRVLNQLDPDGIAITSYSTTDSQAALLWCRQHRRTAVCMLASKSDDAERRVWREWIKGQIVRQFDAALAGGRPQVKYLLSFGLPGDVVFTPYNVVDNDYFQTAADRIHESGATTSALPGLHDARPFFLAINRFIPIKNLATLLHAYAAYRTDPGSDPWRLVLVGDGPERTALEALTASLDAPDVTFAGFQQIDTLPEYYARAGAFVHPSFKETWGLVLNEAMASGLPVLISDRIGAAQDLVIPESNGFLFNPESTTALASVMARMARLSATERHAMGARSRSIVDGWSPQSFATGLWNAFQAGRPRSHRGLSPIAGSAMLFQRLLSRRLNSFHAVHD